MTSAEPWWGSAIVALGSAVTGGLMTQVFGYVRSRTERAQKADSRRRELYEECLSRVGVLIHMPVWPPELTGTTQPVQPLADAVDDLMVRTCLHTDNPLGRQRARELAAAAQHLAETVQAIRADTLPDRNGAVEPTAREEYEQARHKLELSRDEFTATARRQLGLRG